MDRNAIVVLTSIEAVEERNAQKLFATFHDEVELGRSGWCSRCDRDAGGPNQQSARVYARLLAALGIDADDVPLRHANVVGWPQDRARQNALAQGLAQNAVVHRNPWLQQ